MDHWNSDVLKITQKVPQGYPLRDEEAGLHAHSHYWLTEVLRAELLTPALPAFPVPRPSVPLARTKPSGKVPCVCNKQPLVCRGEY